MTFDEVLAQVVALLQREGRVSYRALKRRFDLDDEYIEDLKTEIVDAKQLAVDEDGKVLVWLGRGVKGEADKWRNGEREGETAKRGNGEKEKDFGPRTPNTEMTAAERRQLTVLFCDLVDSTALSARLDPEDWREIVQAYQRTCSEVIHRHEGFIAQYLGDGLLVYFGYPTAHEDDARRAVRAGLEIIQALRIEVLSPLGAKEFLRVRIGIHTGLVVVGEIGSNEKRELLALGETPNIAARIQGLAEPNTVIVSAATHRLIDGQFECQPFGSHLVKGIDTPVAVYHVQSEQQNTSLLGSKATLTPLVGREQEVGLLLDRWEQTKDGRGQVVLLSGEPGIGKSRLAYTLKEHVANDGYLLIESRCSPYHQHSALYPLIEFLQRILLLTRQEVDSEKVGKLERALALYDMRETVPLFTALLSLPTPSHYPPLNLTPQKQKERTLEAAVQWLIAQAEWQATVSVWEDLHWADPSSLEFLTLLVEQLPTTKLLLVLTFRPEFTPPWRLRSHLTQLNLNRIGKRQIENMIESIAKGQELSAEVINQICAKTDGVPLFVEELTKAVIETDGVAARRTVPLQTIPATLQEALLARLDRLSDARQVAQLGATLGREFSYELLRAVAPIAEADLQTALTKLVEAEILYQRGVGQQSRYFFKHALIQDTAYQSLLKSTRQRYHQQIAQTLEERFPDTKEAQPELLAHHYTEAGLIEQAIPYWQMAGQRGSQRSANIEAINHLNRALELLKILPDTLERAQRELTLQIAYGSASMAAKGYCVPEVEKAYARARELCQQLGETPQLFPVLVGLNRFYSARAELQVARELGEQCVNLAQHTKDPTQLVEAHRALGNTMYFLGELTSARSHLEQVIALYDPRQDHALAVFYVVDPAVSAGSYDAWTLWFLGYPDQALKKSHGAIIRAQELSHIFSLGIAQIFTAALYQLRQEWKTTQEWSEKGIKLATERGGVTSVLAWGMTFRGWALSEQGYGERGIAQLRQGMDAWRATGAEVGRTHFLALLAEAYGKAARTEEGLTLLAEAFAQVDKTGERFYEAELYRLKGELLLQQKIKKEESRVGIAHPTDEEAEGYFLKAIDIARQQQSKSLELRAVMSLVRLRQHQAQDHALRTTQHEFHNKLGEAHKMLFETYNWFTEGFDTKDLQEAKALLEWTEPS